MIRVAVPERGAVVGRILGRPRVRLSGVINSDVIDEVLERQFGLADRVVDAAALANSVERFRERGIRLPTFAELADPTSIPPGAVGDADPQGPDARNLWRVHWYNDLAGIESPCPTTSCCPRR